MNMENEQILEELNDPDTAFWDAAFSNHHLSGLLHGCGEKNRQHFMAIMTRQAVPDFSEEFEGPFTQEHFPLPIFAVSANDAVTEKYRWQRKSIQQVYKKRDFFKRILKLLQNS